MGILAWYVAFPPRPKKFGEELAYAVLAALGLVTYKNFLRQFIQQQTRNSKILQPADSKTFGGRSGVVIASF